MLTHLPLAKHLSLKYPRFVHISKICCETHAYGFHEQSPNIRTDSESEINLFLTIKMDITDCKHKINKNQRII